MNAMDDLRQNIRDNLNQALPRTGRAEGIFRLIFKIVVTIFGNFTKFFFVFRNICETKVYHTKNGLECKLR